MSYAPDPRLTLALLHRVPVGQDDLLFDPCTGEGAIAHLLKSHSGRVLTNDINPKYRANFHFDASNPFCWGQIGAEPDWVISQPPLNQSIIPNAFKFARVGIAMLLPISFLEPNQGRGRWLLSHQHRLSNLIVFASDRDPLPCWFVWRKEWTHGGTLIEPCVNWENCSLERNDQWKSLKPSEGARTADTLTGAWK